VFPVVGPLVSRHLLKLRGGELHGLHGRHVG
jgi:hypothetical protein